MSDQGVRSEELKALRRIEELLEVVARQQLAPLIAESLSTPKFKMLYQLTGAEPIQSLVKKTGLSAGSISRAWQKWEEAGLLKKDGKRYRKVV